MDTVYHDPDHHKGSYTYGGYDYPELQGTTMSGHELNYMGVGAGFAASGLPIGLADLATQKYYNQRHGSDPSSNVYNAMHAGYNGYNQAELPCPDAFGTDENSVAPHFP